jgi:hypothetical protein
MKAILTVSPFCAIATPAAAHITEAATNFIAIFIVVSWVVNSGQRTRKWCTATSGIPPKPARFYRASDSLQVFGSR